MAQAFKVHFNVQRKNPEIEPRVPRDKHPIIILLLEILFLFFRCYLKWTTQKEKGILFALGQCKVLATNTLTKKGQLKSCPSSLNLIEKINNQ